MSGNAGGLRVRAPSGRAMAVTAGSQRFRGAYSGLDVDGALLLTTDDGRMRRFSFGDVDLVAEDQGVENGS